jgi:hypothetical protein
MEEIEKEIERLEVLDKKLIAKHQLYLRKLDRVKVSKAIKDKKYAEFCEEYYELRLRVGRKRLEYYQKRQAIIGRPKSINLKEEKIDYLLERV